MRERTRKSSKVVMTSLIDLSWALEAARGRGFAETFLAKVGTMKFLDGRLTLAEDRSLRDLLKTLGEGNAACNAPQITLPAKLGYDLNPVNDGPLAAERMKFVNAGPVKK